MLSLGAHPWIPFGVVPAVLLVPDPSRTLVRVSGSCLLLRLPSLSWQVSCPGHPLSGLGSAPSSLSPTGAGSKLQKPLGIFSLASLSSSALQLFSLSPRSGP